MTWLRFLPVALLAFGFLAPRIARCDSPVTSTPFANAYRAEYPIVDAAGNSGVVDAVIATYLHDTVNPIDVKAAVINALSWDIEGKVNTGLYTQQIYGQPPGKLDRGLLSAEELFVIGYLQLMDDYFHPELALPYLRAAKRAAPADFTIAMILALAEAQFRFADEENLWMYVANVLNDRALNGNMRLSAVQIIVEYMVLYKPGDHEEGLPFWRYL